MTAFFACLSRSTKDDVSYLRGDTNTAGKAAPETCTRVDIEQAFIRMVQTIHIAIIEESDERRKKEQQSAMSVAGKLEVDSSSRGIFEACGLVGKEDARSGGGISKGLDSVWPFAA